MFRKFEDFFGETTKKQWSIVQSPYRRFVARFGGKQFAHGLFNAFTETDIYKMEAMVYKAYPEFANKTLLFGYDWLGRIYGITKKNGKEMIMQFEIGSLDVIRIPCDFLTFLNEEIPQYHKECLASEYFEQWKTIGDPPRYGRCIGYKVPLFLGGKDALENLEDSDMEVYWHILSSASGM